MSKTDSKSTQSLFVTFISIYSKNSLCWCNRPKKGHIRCAKIPINPEQFNLIEKLGGGSRYGQLEQLEDILKIEYGFSYKGYCRCIGNLQFRSQK